jgi:hypothetical protein
MKNAMIIHGDEAMSNIKRLAHTYKSVFKNRPIATTLIVIFVTLWSCMAFAKGPNPNAKDDDAKNKNRGASSSFQNNQAVRNSARNYSAPRSNISSPASNAVNLPSAASSRASFSRAPLASDAGRTTQFRRELSSPSNQTNFVPQAQNMQQRSLPRAADVRTNTVGPVNIPNVQRKSDGLNQLGNTNFQERTYRNIQPRTDRTNENPKTLIAADASKTSNRSSDDAKTRSGRQDLSSQLQNKVQGNNSGGTNQINQNLQNQNLRSRSGAGNPAVSGSGTQGNISLPPPAGMIKRGGASDVSRGLKTGGQNIISSGSDQSNQNLNTRSRGIGGAVKTQDGGTGISDTGKNLGLQQGVRTDNGPSMSEIRKRLNDQGRGKITTSGNAGDKIDTNTLKKNISPDTTSKGLPPPDVSSTDRVKKDLGIRNKGLGAGDKGLDISNKGLDTGNKRLGIGNKDLDTGNKGLGISDKKLDTSDKGLGISDKKLDTGDKGLDLNNKGMGEGDRGKRGSADLDLTKDFKKHDGPPDLKLQDGKAGPDINTKIDRHLPPQIGDIKTGRADINKSRFPDRLKSGDFDKITKGEMAKKVKLSDQFHMMDKGDVARRMDLHKHINNVDIRNIQAKNFHQMHDPGVLRNVNDFYAYRPYYHHGFISPAYTRSCFKFGYYGPAFFTGVCWYPHWHPWVSWSWGYHINPIWDPRPLWCRPVIYDPYYDWVYWQTPVWVSLPAEPSGTWVDVQMPAVPAAQYDLQLLAVRFVDAGHPEEKLGPRYRVWFRNNSDQPIATPFSVMLFAGNDERVTADLPHSGVLVRSMDAGDVQSVDIRLPMEVTQMARDADGNPAPFQMLHAMVDANREVQDVAWTNNGAKITRDEILPVDPAAFEVDPTNAAVGGELVLAGEGLGPQPGQVLVNVGGQELQAEVLGWYDLGVRINVPQIDLKEATPAEVVVVRGDGAATNPIKVTLQPGQAGPALNPPPPPPAPNP